MKTLSNEMHDELSNLQDSEPVFEEWAAESTSDGKQILLQNMIDIEEHKPIVNRQLARRKKKVVVPCEVCGLDLKWPSRIKEHMRTHTGEKPFRCDQCGKRFSQQTPFMNHYRAQHLNDTPFICGFGCGKKFVSNARRNAHELKHRGEKRQGPPRPHLKPAKKLICPVMDAVPLIDDGGLAMAVANYVEPPSISNGFQEPTNPLIYPSTSSSSSSVLTTTRIPTESQNPYITEDEELLLEMGGASAAAAAAAAELSEKAQEANARIDDVIATVLERVLAPLPPPAPIPEEIKPPPKRAYQSNRTSTIGHCNVCGIYLKHPSKIAAHIRTHTGDKLFQCGECGMKVSTAASLRIHITRMHTGERPFACTVCEQRFVTESVRKEHELATHSGVKRYKCMVKDCGAAFTRRVYMMKHRKNVHPEMFTHIFNEHDVAAEEDEDPVLESGGGKMNYIYEDGVGEPIIMMDDLVDDIGMEMGGEHFDEEEYVEQGGI